ncbi:hypothetical protein O6H91_04G090200 [Diphasiastrum complanatum]|uniref:Uncharacterized protein n=1 Tax=Diphasiastrum complanatum TaxID=34168 RepID=A0ACC2DYX9_DIPCM|nr:hypothetical protein O6H91_04G090200 [Diphasiastrum complanatum]
MLFELDPIADSGSSFDRGTSSLTNVLPAVGFHVERRPMKEKFFIDQSKSDTVDLGITIKRDLDKDLDEESEEDTEEISDRDLEKVLEEVLESTVEEDSDEPSRDPDIESDSFSEHSSE